MMQLRRMVALISLGLLAIAVGIPQAGAAPAQPAAHSAPIQMLSTRGSDGMAASTVGQSGINLVYHGGKIMLSSTTYLIYWEPPTLQTHAATHVSAMYNSLLARYFSDVGYGGIYKNDTQYYQTVNATKSYVTTKSVRGGAWLDTSAYPTSGCTDSVTPGNCLTDAQIQAEVAKAMRVNGWTGGTNHMFFVYTAYNEGSCFDGSDTSCAFTDYCAYHSYFTLPNKQYVVYGNMPYTGTDLGACGVDTSPNHDVDADSTINVTSHEHMEGVTDPFLNAWYQDSVQQSEIGDLCAWYFGSVTLDSATANARWSGHYYIVQTEWDNAVKGCVITGP